MKGSLYPSHFAEKEKKWRMPGWGSLWKADGSNDFKEASVGILGRSLGD